MADDLKVEEGAGSVPQNQVSNSIDDSTKNLLIEIGGKVQQFEKELRGLQGRQDKTENAFKSQFAEYDKLIKKGMSHDEAVETLESKQRESSTLAELQKQIADLAAHVKGNGNAPSASQEVVQAFADLGLDTRDPAVIIEMQKYKGVDDAVAGAYKLKRSTSQAPSPTSAQSLSAPVTPKGQPSVEELTEKYKNDMLAAKGKPEQLRSIKAKYIQQGVDVHNVSF